VSILVWGVGTENLVMVKEAIEESRGKKDEI
jgi:hypothetical protein